ncbi:MAG: AbrB/MazE/SpoVT family DNA-binding domain-containing protein [Defluviitaleaceae bacterium]|nr:AbrB/MazE/SpoVT family DNA-binding domain-containing protein [Defluviitaleaceae bacterium]
MRATGIVRNVDDVGRLVIPKEIRKIFGISREQGLEIHVDGQNIIIRKYYDKCVLCDSDDGLTSFNGKFICCHCTGQIGQLCLSVFT